MVIVIVLGAGAEIGISMLLAAKIILLIVRILLLIRRPVRTCNALIAPIVCSGGILGFFVVFRSISWPVDPIT